MHQRHKIVCVVAAVLLTSCASATAPIKPPAASLPAPQTAPLCENAIAKIYIGYPTARVNKCDVRGKSNFSFTIRPEAKTDPQGGAINDSPWYGFRVDPKQAGTVRISLSYENGRHRYRPKISHDGINWAVVPATQTTKKRPTKYDMRVKTDGRPFLISAQEIFTKAAHDQWTARIAEMPFVAKSQIGRSRDGHPIYMLDVKTDPMVQKPYVMLLGRQHPPEVTGALALLSFTDTVLGDSALARRFRARFNIVIIPMLNPDGVTAGHWRFNKGGMDLNRDWGPFSQPETQAVQFALKRFDTGQDEIALFLDFHSTHRNLLYTQADDEPTTPPLFAKRWVAAVDARLDDSVYAFTREARHNSGKPISKNYMYESYGIAAITYEVGDATSRGAIKLSASVFAEEMMQLMLKHQAGKP